MKTTSLINKLNKLNIESERKNNRIEFVINNNVYFTLVQDEETLFFCQAKNEIFFDNLNQVLRHENRN